MINLFPSPYEKLISLLNSLEKERTLKLFSYENRGEEYHLPFASRIEFLYKGQEFTGFGIGENEDESSGKALMELLEHLCLFYSQPTFYENSKGETFDETRLKEKFPQVPHLIPENSNGMAIHTKIEDAYTNALKELIERHTLLKALACHISPMKINADILKLGDQVKIPSNVELRFYAYKGPLHYHVVICETHIKEDGPGSYFRFGASQNLDQAIKNSFYESVIPILFSIKNKNNTPPACQIDPQRIESFSDFHRYSGNTYWSDFFEKTHSKTVLPEIDSFISKESFYHTKIPLPDFLSKLKNSFTCIRVINPFLQQLFFDDWNKEHINPLAINEKTILPKTPHFIP